MSTFTKIEPQALNGNPFEMIEKQAALFTAGTLEDFNTMTIGWGTMGDLWNKPVFTAYIRPSRYTYEFSEKNDTFTIAFFGTPRPDAIAVLGTKSGRDIDKIHNSGLTPIELDGNVAFSEAHTVFVCKKMYCVDMDPAQISEEGKNKWYANGDIHKIYTGEITAVYVK